MFVKSEITVTSKNNIMINNLYYRNDNGAKTLVVVFPGGGYSCDMPLLYYCTVAALQGNCDVINLKYFFQCAKIRFSSDDYKQVIQDCYDAVKACILDINTYENIIFASKSVGTVYASEAGLLLTERKVKHFYLTPLPATIPYIEKRDCTVIAGDKDPLLPDEYIQIFKNLPMAKVHILNNVDHSLENLQNCFESLKTLTTVTNLWVNFLSASKA